MSLFNNPESWENTLNRAQKKHTLERNACATYIEGHVKSLMALTNDKDPAVKIETVKSLRELFTSCTDNVRKYITHNLIFLIDDTKDTVREESISTLVHIISNYGMDKQLFDFTYESLLADTKPEIRKYAAQLLGAWGSYYKNLP